MATKFQEHCPDIERQEADVQKLNKRVNNVQKQIDSRWDIRGQDSQKMCLKFGSVILEKSNIIRNAPPKKMQMSHCKLIPVASILQVPELAKSQNGLQELPQWLWQSQQLAVSCP